ncbi:preprotein translocase subunit SecE [Caloranaerobacter ferrireducens]|uniref:preprotein translocase subunit SecE n=1 Tax=Caloranaerobacter ferrireducens TaxID=1323370 RepID=UPI00084DFD25|nr:preprotein translocase subunit SecE [Caloranaerobacter ferrireducens]
MAAQTSADKGAKKIGGFFKGVKAELKKVSWPNKKQLVNYTTVVLVSCALMALLVWLLDTTAHQLLKFILG